MDSVKAGLWEEQCEEQPALPGGALRGPQGAERLNPQRGGSAGPGEL